jgi:hypothetical protein
MTRTVSLLVLTLAASVHAQDSAKSTPPPALQMTAEGKKFVEGWHGAWTSTDTTYTMGDQKSKSKPKPRRSR